MKNQNLSLTENVIFYTIIFATVSSFAFGLLKFSNYDGRMKAYNHHMCVDVYGLNEQCK